MTTTSITFQQANTTDGTYDVAESLPYPVTVEAADPRPAYIGHPGGRAQQFATLIGFTASPDDYAPQHVRGLPADAEALVGMFPVYCEDSTGRFYTDTRVIQTIVSTETAEAKP